MTLHGRAFLAADLWRDLFRRQTRDRLAVDEDDRVTGADARSIGRSAADHRDDDDAVVTLAEEHADPDHAAAK